MSTFDKEKNTKFILELIKDKESLAYWMTVSMRSNNYYWASSALYLMGSLDQLDKDEAIDFLMKCKTKDGVFAGNIGLGSNIHNTLSVIQTLILYNRFDLIDPEPIVKWVAKLQNKDGSFSNGQWDGEVDTKFTFCAFAILKLLNRLDAIDVNLAVEWLLKCQNWDGGFGCFPHCESHCGQTYTALAALKIANALERADNIKLRLFLSERQTLDGGFNGRPEKDSDVCYSWWAGASIAIMNEYEKVDVERLRDFILTAQDPEKGGIADRPGNHADPYHTFFGCAGLSLFGFFNLPKIDPVLAMPVDVLSRHFARF